MHQLPKADPLRQVLSTTPLWYIGTILYILMTLAPQRPTWLIALPWLMAYQFVYWFGAELESDWWVAMRTRHARRITMLDAVGFYLVLAAFAALPFVLQFGAADKDAPPPIKWLMLPIFLIQVGDVVGTYLQLKEARAAKVAEGASDILERYFGNSRKLKRACLNLLGVAAIAAYCFVRPRLDVSALIATQVLLFVGLSLSESRIGRWRAEAQSELDGDSSALACDHCRRPIPIK